jgi:hypothetical protein
MRGDAAYKKYNLPCVGSNNAIEQEFKEQGQSVKNNQRSAA